ncbi:uncharacterized protein LOC134229260 [Saccostrea cucullata]|uniref:uncharacterized protein LOC134229260 n=1 Tax=Saccostrea cuccullata TaxID=36930 RepID=UPI002ED1917E
MTTTWKQHGAHFVIQCTIQPSSVLGPPSKNTKAALMRTEPRSHSFLTYKAHVDDPTSTASQKDALRNARSTVQQKPRDMQVPWLNAKVDEIQCFAESHGRKNFYCEVGEVYGPPPSGSSPLFSDPYQREGKDTRQVGGTFQWRSEPPFYHQRRSHQPTAQSLDAVCTLDEIQRAFSLLSTGIPPGGYSIPAEIYKEGGVALVEKLHHLLVRGSACPVTPCIHHPDCGVHQKLDVVILYDVSGSSGSSGFSYQRQFIVSLADALHLSSTDTNMAGLGVDDSAYYGWGLRDYFTSSAINSKLLNISLNLGNGGSDWASGFEMAWTHILSNSTRQGSQAWLIVLTDTSYTTSTNELNEAKAAGVKVGFVGTASASSYSTYASDTKYIVSGMSWATLSSYITSVVEFFCSAYCENFEFYYDLPNSMSVQADTHSNVGYYLSRTDVTYDVHCCGAVSSVEFKATTSGTFKFQIWRNYVLVSETSVSASAGYQKHNFSPKLAVQAKDVIGWYSPGVNPIGIASTCSGDLCTSGTKRATNMGTVAVGASYSWSNATELPDTAFAIKLTIDNSTVPTYTPTSPVYVSELLAVGSIITVFRVTDDTGDVITYSNPSSPYFSFDQLSGEITLISPLPTPHVETPYILTIDVMDSCFNTATATVNITSFFVPPAFHNLPTEVEIGDDVKAETLLIIINMTDGYASSIICTKTSMFPETQFFRLDDYMNGTAAVYLNADSKLDFNTVEEYNMTITCNGSTSLESGLTIRILDKSTKVADNPDLPEAVIVVICIASIFALVGFGLGTYCLHSKLQKSNQKRINALDN